MVWLVMLAEMFARTVKASLLCSNASGKSFGDLGMTTPFLNQSEQCPVLRAELRERVPQRIEFLGVDGTRRLGNVFVLFPERQKNSPQFLPTQLIDAGVTS